MDQPPTTSLAVLPRRGVPKRRVMRVSLGYVLVEIAFIAVAFAMARAIVLVGADYGFPIAYVLLVAVGGAVGGFSGHSQGIVIGAVLGPFVAVFSVVILAILGHVLFLLLFALGVLA